MKRFAALLLGLMLCFSTALAQEDTLILTAVVEGRETLALKAPASGELLPFNVRTGDVISAGETVFEVEPVRVYADVEGTVANVFVAPGSIADAAVSRYGSAVQVEYADRYVIHANARTGTNNAENRDLHVGAPVYLLSNNEEHSAGGVITSVSGYDFTVDVIGGDLIYHHDVKIYRDPEYGSRNLIARSSLSTAAPREYTASGTVLEVAVKHGDEVSPGDFLFSYVPDVLEPGRRGQPGTAAVRAQETLIVTGVSVQAGASVQKGQALATAIRQGEYELTAQADERDLPFIAVGDVFTVQFEEVDLPAMEAEVLSISPWGVDQGDTSEYTVRLAFDVPVGVYPGMHAVLEK